jgi:hypothetical protein
MSTRTIHDISYSEYIHRSMHSRYDKSFKSIHCEGLFMDGISRHPATISTISVYRRDRQTMHRDFPLSKISRYISGSMYMLTMDIRLSYETSESF